MSVAAACDPAKNEKEAAMYNMLNGPNFGIGLPKDLSEGRLGRAARWRGFLAVLGLFGAAAFAIAAPLTDREIVPATFVDQIGALFDADMPDNGGFTLAATAGEPVISTATSYREPGAP